MTNHALTSAALSYRNGRGRAGHLEQCVETAQVTTTWAGTLPREVHCRGTSDPQAPTNSTALASSLFFEYVDGTYPAILGAPHLSVVRTPTRDWAHGVVIVKGRNVEVSMATELELKMLARLRAHEVLIQNLLRLAFNGDPDAIREFAARQNARFDTHRLPDLDTATAARLPYETQEALASILDAAIRHVESRLPREPSA